MNNAEYNLYNLLDKFLHYLWLDIELSITKQNELTPSNEMNADLLNECLVKYSKILGYKKTVYTFYFQDLDFLIKQKEENGCYTAEFQMRFNQWLLQNEND